MNDDHAQWDPEPLAREVICRGARRLGRRRIVRRGAIGTAVLCVAAAVAFISIRPLPSVARKGNGGPSATTTSLLPTTSSPTSTTPTTELPTPTTTTTTRAPMATVPTGVPPTKSSVTTTTTLAGGLTKVLTGEVVNQQGTPVVGAAVVDDYTGQVVHSWAGGRFSISCAPQPNWPGGVDADQLWVASWLPNIDFGSSGIAQDSAPADVSVGWTYVTAGSGFEDTWEHAPVCARLKSPIKIVLPAAGSLNVTGNWPAGTEVSLFWPGLSSGDVSNLLAQPAYGVGPAAQIISHSGCALCINTPRYWNETASPTAVFPALTPTGYSVWVGAQLATDCADIHVTAGQTTAVTCTLTTPPTTTTTTSTTTSTTNPTTTTSSTTPTAGP